MIKNSKHTKESIEKMRLATKGQHLGHTYWGPKDMIAHLKRMGQISGNKRKKIYLPKKCLECDKKFEVQDWDKNKNKFCSRNCSHINVGRKSKIGKLNKGKNPPTGSGRCKWYEYHSSICGSIKVQGTWELRYVRCLDKIGLPWRPNHNKDRFEYINIRGNLASYNPDFWTNGKYVDVKGYIDKQTEHKLKAIKNLDIPLEIVTWEKLRDLEINLFGEPVGGKDTPKSFINNYKTICLNI